jgi:hypothetical protein
MQSRSAKRVAAGLFSSERECPSMDHDFSGMVIEEQAFLYQSITIHERHDFT